MPKRNFDNYTIIQRLQNRIYARNLYINNTSGQAIINNPQTTDGSSSRMASYRAGAQTEYYRGLKGGETISLGGSLVILPFTVPDAPTNLIATPNNAQVSISFTQGFYGRSPITNYLYSIDNGAFVAFSPVSIVSPVVITGLTNATTYSIQLKAVNSIGESVASDVIVATPIAVPFPPTSLVVTPSNRQVSISFVEGFDEGNPIINYEYSTDGISFTPFHPAKIAGPLVITDLTNGASYSIKLKAVNRIGASLSSSSITAIPLTVPSVPTNLTAIASNKQILISFTQGFNGGSNITNYAYSTDGVSFNEIDPIDTISPIVIKNLTNGRTYSITLRAINKAGQSVSSDYVIAKPVAVPSPPTILSAIPSNRQISISFTPGFDEGDSINAYQYSINNGLFITTTTVNPQVITKLDNETPLENGVSYSIMLRAINNIGASITSNTVSAIPVTIPSAPTNLRATPADRQVSIEYAPGFNGGSPFTNYEYSLNNDSFVSTTIANPMVITGLVNGTIYSTVLRAVTVVGKSVASDSVSFKPVTLPSAPINLRATPADRQVSIEYTPGFNGGSDINNYEYSINNGSFVSTMLKPIVITTLADRTSLNNGTTYSLVLRAVTDVGKSVVSDSISFKPVTLPSAPTILRATPTDRQVSIEYAPGYDGGSNITNYEYSLNNDTFVSTIANPIVITNLFNGTIYSFLLRAETIVGKSVVSDPVSFKPVTIPSVPTDLTAIPTDKQAIISFTEGFNGGSNIENYAYSLNNSTFTLFDPAKKTGPLVIGGLVNGTLYSIMLKAITIIGESVASSKVSVTPYTVPSTPLITSSTISDKQINIMTDQESNGGSAFINYEYSTDNGATFRLFNPAITLVNNRYGTLSITKLSSNGTTSLTNGTLYLIHIRATNIAGSSVATSISAIPATFPDPPTGLSEIVGNKIIRIDFTPGFNGGSALTNYEYSTDGITFIEFSPVDTATPVIISKQSITNTPALVNGTTYSIKLKAKNSIGSSVASTTLLAKPYTIPDIPVIIGIISGNDGVLIINFTLTSDGGSALTKYQYSVNNGTFYDISVPTGNYIRITGLTVGISYYAQLKAVSNVGTSTASAASESVLLYREPWAPIITSIDADNGKAIINFTADNGGGYIQNFGIIKIIRNYVQNPFYELNPVVTQSPITINDLLNGTTYDFQIRTKTSVGWSPLSNSVSVIPRIPTVPAAPTITSMTAGPRSSDTPITVNFTPVDNGGRPITGIYYKRSTESVIPADAFATKYFTYFNYVMAYPTTSPIILYMWSQNDLYLKITVQIALENAIGRSAFSAPFTLFLTPGQ